MTLVRQLAFDDFGTPLHQATFVVVDLETNGLPNHDAGITEIGAVKVKGGEVLGEFSTLVNSGGDIPPFITLLTGINNDMLIDAPALSAVLPQFLDWAGDCVWVAHNASFDMGFLKSSAAKCGINWRPTTVLDTVVMAKAVLHPDEVPNRKLATLAAHFHSPTKPVHRALADAQATVHVMHALFERFGSLGVQTVEELQDVGVQINPTRRKKRTLAEPLPEGPGVYIFKDDQERPLYVGKSKNLRKRALSYFTRSENRDRMGRMVDMAASIGYIECATELEASVRELRIILEHKPAFNRAGTHAERNIWLRLSNETFPRLSAVRNIRPDLGNLHIGPVRNMEQAALVIDAATSAIGLRTCTQKLRPQKPASSCALAEMGRCSAPCELRVDVSEYGELVDQFVGAINGDDAIETELRSRLAGYAAEQRFEEAAVIRDRLAAWLAATVTTHKYQPLAAVPELIAAAPADTGWEVHVIRHGFLANSGLAPTENSISELGRALALTAQQVSAEKLPAPAGSMSELRLIYSWLNRPGTRLFEIEGEWASRWPSQLRSGEELKTLQESRQTASLAAPTRKNARFTAPR